MNLTEKNKTLIIELPIELTAAMVEEFISESKTWLLRPVGMFIFDFKAVRSFNPLAYRGFLIFVRLARQGEKQVVSINMTPQINQQLKSDGLLGALNPMAVSPASQSSNSPNSAPGPKASVDVALLNPFINAVVNTLKIQAQTESHPGKPYLLKAADKQYKPTIGIIGLINLNSSKFTGSIALAFNEKVFLQIYENMFGEKHEKITVELQDAAAEILNIIYGTAKTQLNDTPGFDLQPAIPTVLAGEKINLQQGTREMILILPFESSAGPFQMEIVLETKPL